MAVTIPTRLAIHPIIIDTREVPKTTRMPATTAVTSPTPPAIADTEEEETIPIRKRRHPQDISVDLN